MTSEAAFLQLEPIWRDVMANSSAPSPFHSWDFVEEWWRTFVLGRVGGATGDYEVVVVYDSVGRAVAILPFYLENNLGRAGLGTTLQPFGRSNSTEVMTDEPVAIYRSGFEPAASDAVKSHLTSGLRARRWDIAAVRGNRTTSAIPAQATRFSGTAQTVAVTRVCRGPMAAVLSNSWAGYRATLSKSMRDNVAYYPRKLTREQGAWAVRVVRGPSEIKEATETLIRLHRGRSTSPVGIPHFNHIASEGQADFLMRWFVRLARRGQVSIFLLEVGGLVVAAQAFLDAPGCVSVYYSGYDDAFYRYSPLTIITTEAIRAAIADGAGRVEFPPGITAWISRWNAREHRRIAEVSLYSTRPRALARGVARRLYFRLTAS